MLFKPTLKPRHSEINAQRNKKSNWQRIITLGRAFPGDLSNSLFPPSRLSPPKRKELYIYKKVKIIMRLGLNPAKSASHPTRGDELRIGTVMHLPHFILSLFSPVWLLFFGGFLGVFFFRDFFPSKGLFFSTLAALLGSPKSSPPPPFLRIFAHSIPQSRGARWDTPASPPATPHPGFFLPVFTLSC